MKAPMTAQEARDNVAEMIRNTSKRARAAMLRLALGPLGNLSEEARKVYALQLHKDSQ